MKTALRRAVFMRLPGAGRPPIFFVICARPNGGPYIYEHFIPGTVCWDNTLDELPTAVFHGTIGPSGDRATLYWRESVTEHPSGTFISAVEYPRSQGRDLERFPARALPVVESLAANAGAKAADCCPGAETRIVTG